MMNFLVSLWRNNVVTTFLAGLVVLLPVVLTILIIAWIVDFLRGTGVAAGAGNSSTTAVSTSSYSTSASPRGCASSV